MAPLRFNSNNWASLLIRMGLCVTFVYASVSALLQPELWVDYMPHFLTVIAPAKLLLDSFSIFQLLLTFWLMSGRQLWAAGLIATLLLIGIVMTSPSLFVITFRDLGLGLCALALVCMHPPDAATMTKIKRPFGR